MKQKKLVKKVYKACVEHDQAAIITLRKEEFAKIIKHKEEGKSFGVKWAVARI
jgi:pyruvate/2-oxoglutarate dehydrogenase complex dihydrolipoamide dehydrogenase (E3) component